VLAVDAGSSASAVFGGDASGVFRRGGDQALREGCVVAFWMKQAAAFGGEAAGGGAAMRADLGLRWARRAAPDWQSCDGRKVLGGSVLLAQCAMGTGGSVLLLQEGGPADAWRDVDERLSAAGYLIRSPAGVVACVVRVDPPAVWLRPGTMVVLGLGQCSDVPCRHGARQDMVVRAASGGPASGRLFMDLVRYVGV
jgi:hypothetical protein